MRLIDADVRTAELDDLCMKKIADAEPLEAMRLSVLTNFAKDVLRLSPTVDAELVIKCKDCRYFYKYDDGCGECDFHDWYRADPTENDYCSKAERR